MKDLGFFRVEPYVEGYHYKIGTMVEKEDGLYRTDRISEEGLKKIYDSNGPEERMVSINNKTYFELETEKPPLGLKPKKFFMDARRDDIMATVERYFERYKEIPIEWIEEYNEIVGKE